MKDLRITLSDILDSIQTADFSNLRRFLLDDPSRPLIVTGSGAAETVADYAALLYGARGGVATSVSPYTMNSYSDDTLKTAKILLISVGGHNNDIVFAARRALEINPEHTASFTFSQSERNEVRKLFAKSGNTNSFDMNVRDLKDGFVSVKTPLAYFVLLSLVFDPTCDLSRLLDYSGLSYRLELNGGSGLSLEDIKDIHSFIVLQGSWGRPVAFNLEGKLVESGHATASVYDYRNYCHGRFIYTSNHLDDSAVILFVTPRERDIAERTRGFLPESVKLVIIETSEKGPEASLDLLVRSTAFFLDLCREAGVCHESPRNPGKIDKRVPMWIPFASVLKKTGPLRIK